MDRGVMCLSPETMTKPRMPISFDCLWQRPNRKVHILLLLHTYMRLLSASTKNIFEHMQVTLETAWLFCLCVIQAIYLPLQLQYSFHTFGTNHTRCSCILEKCIFLLEGPAWVQHQITVPSAAQLWESCCVISCVLERANSQQPLSLLLLDQRKSLLTLRGLYKRKDLAGMWLKKAPCFLPQLQKALCWEQSSLPNPSEKPHLCALFSWALWGRGTSRWTECWSYIEGLHGQRATKEWKHKNPWMGHNCPQSMQTQPFCPFLDVGISIFEGPGLTAFICIL